MTIATWWPHRIVASAVLALLLAPSPAHAQRDQFLEAVIQLYQALPGTFGDEGPQLAAHVEEMSAALARWEDAIRESERELRPQAQGGNPQAALQAHTVLGSLYLEGTRFDAALREFDEDIAIDPGRAVFHRVRGLILQAMRREDEAAEAFRAAWLREPDDPQNAYRLVVYRSPATRAADVERALGTLASLERALTRRERAGADAPFMNVRAINDDSGGMNFVPAAYVPAFSLLLKGDYAAAVVALRSAVAADPLNADPALRAERTTQGIAALKQRLVDSAIAHFEAALAAGESAQVHRLLGTACWVSGDLGKSVLHLRAAVRLSPADERSWLALARTLDSSGSLTEAVDALRQAVEMLPDAGALRWQLSVAAGKRQRTDAPDLELAAVAERLTLLAGKGELFDRAGRLAHGQLDYERALTLFKERVALTPNNAAAHKTLGRALIDAGREDEGYAELVIALGLNPLDTETLTTLGQLHLMAGRPAQAVDAFERALALKPDHSEALHALSDALIRSGRTAEGQRRREESEQLVTKDVDDQRRRRNTAMLTVQAELEMAGNDYAKAIDTWQQAIALESRDRASHLRLAEALAATGRLEDAAKEVETAIALNAGPDAHWRLGELYAMLGRSADSARERQTYTEKRLEELRGAGSQRQ